MSLLLKSVTRKIIRYHESFQKRRRQWRYMNSPKTHIFEPAMASKICLGIGKKNKFAASIVKKTQLQAGIGPSTLDSPWLCSWLRVSSGESEGKNQFLFLFLQPINRRVSSSKLLEYNLIGCPLHSIGVIEKWNTSYSLLWSTICISIKSTLRLPPCMREHLFSFFMKFRGGEEGGAEPCIWEPDSVNCKLHKTTELPVTETQRHSLPFNTYSNIPDQTTNLSTPQMSFHSTP